MCLKWSRFRIMSVLTPFSYRSSALIIYSHDRPAPRLLAIHPPFHPTSLSLSQTLILPLIQYRTSGFSFSETTLLLFQLGATASDNTMPDNRGTIPGHGPSQNVLDLLVPCDNPPSSSTQPPASLNQHFCLAVQSPDDVRAWEKWFDEKNVKILGRVDWELGGRSVYFADPDGNVGEVGSRGIWRHY
jgi:catechol 2,3-dioxygenase-like lactoylglutathione lyase family enzyme